MEEENNLKQPIVKWKTFGSQLEKLVKIILWPATIVILTLILKNTIAKIATANLDSHLILEYITILRWPLVSTAMLLILRPHIPSLINRMRKAGFGSASFEFETKQPRDIPSAAELKKDEASDPINEDEANTKMKALLTSAEAKLAYEQVYNYIFGTQIRLLLRLRTYPEGLKEEQLTEFYDAYKSLASNTPAMNTFMQYIEYLKNNSLITFNPENGVFSLTYAGEFFLRYLAERNLLNDYKPL